MVPCIKYDTYISYNTGTITRLHSHTHKFTYMTCMTSYVQNIHVYTHRIYFYLHEAPCVFMHNIHVFVSTDQTHTHVFFEQRFTYMTCTTSCVCTYMYICTGCIQNTCICIHVLYIFICIHITSTYSMHIKIHYILYTCTTYTYIYLFPRIKYTHIHVFPTTKAPTHAYIHTHTSPTQIHIHDKHDLVFA